MSGQLSSAPDTRHTPDADSASGVAPVDPNPDAAGTGNGPDRADRWGWLSVGAITAVIAVSWLPLITAPFGDNHLGRIIGRYALHLRNLQEDGLVGSSFSADWLPYASASYAHHPPLLNALTALFGLLPGDSEAEVWLAPYLLALLVIPAAAALLRGFGISWTSTLLSIGLTVATTFFWVYSPLMFDLGPILALSAAVVHLRRRPDPPRWLVLSACAAALLACLVSWPGIALSAVLGLWLFAARRLDRVTVAVGASMVLGVALSLTFVVGISGISNLSNQTDTRTAGGDYTALEFLRRQWQYADLMLPKWYLLLLPIGVVMGLLVRRTRFYVAVATAFTLGWMLVLNNGAFIHSYWSYPALILGLVGIGVLLDWAAARVPTALTARSVAAGVLLVAYLAFLIFGPTERKHVAEPIDAGRLVAEHGPASGQRSAWTVGGGLSTPRWLAYYWDLTPRALNEELVLGTDPAAVHQPRPEDLVLMNMNRKPEWLPESIKQQAVAEEGYYGLFRVADLRAAAQG
ncbi:hypothetical protein O7627_03955 [Solwaraspora sp. WMMD1047]|uniref:hypothetical protein n=1 Tax=Solwaraspora sp. WMMD1047 TaxID=3016102 RepID=UPI002416212D|nr:hypothetical protein [Solwaraspora sp. WMMD1047]MDG4828456.1 hypothetical protein [Solwaraspora sp. WMMD1047]